MEGVVSRAAVEMGGSGTAEGVVRSDIEGWPREVRHREDRRGVEDNNRQPAGGLNSGVGVFMHNACTIVHCTDRYMGASGGWRTVLKVGQCQNGLRPDPVKYYPLNFTGITDREKKIIELTLTKTAEA